ncbi:MAG: hypothetical protein K2L31_08545, partial [Muribaculum sp.]|nr:hypothetical protein [Muribaculum sp.]
MKLNSAISAVTLLSVATTACNNTSQPTDVLYSSEEFSVYTDRVVQGGFTARAVSPTEITSDYRSPEESGISQLLHFKLSLNSRDNELPQGKTHDVMIGADTIFTFGEALAKIDSIKADTPAKLEKNTRWTLKVNMQPVLNSFKERGYYVTPTNDTIFKDDFKGVWVAGSVEPLTWDFENLYGKHDRKLNDRGDGIYEVTLNLNTDKELQPNK